MTLAKDKAIETIKQSEEGQLGKLLAIASFTEQNEELSVRVRGILEKVETVLSKTRATGSLSTSRLGSNKHYSEKDE